MRYLNFITNVFDDFVDHLDGQSDDGAGDDVGDDAADAGVAARGGRRGGAPRLSEAHMAEMEAEIEASRRELSKHRDLAAEQRQAAELQLRVR
jgi:hypothetical protein